MLRADLLAQSIRTNTTEGQRCAHREECQETSSDADPPTDAMAVPTAVHQQLCLSYCLLRALFAPCRRCMSPS